MKPPIADPIETGLLEEGEQPFYLEFWGLLRRIFGTYLLTIGPFFWAILLPVFHRSHGRTPPHATLTMLGIVVGVCFFAALVATAIGFSQPVRVSAHGLKGTNWVGLPREVAWAQIGAVRFFWLVLPYALLSTPQKRNFVWLPLILKDKERFARAVEKYTTSDNPLRLFLRKRGY